MKVFLIIFGFLSALAGFIMAQGKDSTEIKMQLKKRQIESNYYKADVTVYKDILPNLKVVEKSDENWRTYYYCGFVYLQLGKIYREEDEDQAVAFFEQAADQLKLAFQLNSQAEFLVLLSSVYGKLASISIFNAIAYGRDSENYLEQARALNDSLVFTKLNLVEATHLMFTPAIFGGDKKKAEKLLLNSLKSGLPQSNLLINWAGVAELYAYLAQLEFERENYTKAAFYCQKALLIEEDYTFVLDELKAQIIHDSGEKNEIK